jgi:hypothetical protein
MPLSIPRQDRHSARRGPISVPSGEQSPQKAAVAQAPNDPANKLYNEACELLHAAAELREAADQPAAAPAIAPTLGWLEAALENLAAATEELKGTTLRRVHTAGCVPDAECDAAETARLARSFDDVVRSLAASRRACAAARARCGPTLADLTAI